MALGVAPPAHHVLLLFAEARQELGNRLRLSAGTHVPHGGLVQIVHPHMAQLQQAPADEQLVHRITHVGQGQGRQQEGILHRVRHLQRFRNQLIAHFRFHRTPCGVSSRMMPMSFS
jgi:alcohol dehydrogenase YqhD (iron-dependent ADH family)